jgi:inorganic phosphate transporter, PiT family
VLTCTGVSFAHGSNDGQKGMGLIMLILIGAVPTAYALNHALPASSTPAFLQSMHAGGEVFRAHANGITLDLNAAQAKVTDAVRTRNTSRLDR